MRNLTADCASSPGPARAHYVEHLRSPHLSIGTYTLPRGGTDEQDPHTEDEVYIVFSGYARFESATSSVDVRAGSVLYVPAHEPHRFTQITEDLTVMVLFAPAEQSLEA